MMLEQTEHRSLGSPHQIPPVLRVRELCVDYKVKGTNGRRANLQAVKNVSFDIERGETLGVVGESGCGKTSLIKAVLGLQPVSQGSIEVDGSDVGKMSRRALRKYRSRYQVVFQDPYSSLNPRMSISEVISEPLQIQNLPRSSRVGELLAFVGLSAEDGLKRPSDFSGGQRQRISIARALALEPQLLVLDEPVSALDKSIQAQVLNLLSEIQQLRSVSYLFISHDLSVVRHIADRVAVMYMGRIVEAGGCEEVLSRPAHPYTQELVASIPLARVGAVHRVTGPLVASEAADPLRLPSGCSLRDRCSRAAQRCVDEVPTLETWRGDNQQAACFFPG